MHPYRLSRAFSRLLFFATLVVNTSSRPVRPFSLRTWWHSLPEHRQDRLASLSPLLSVLLFALAVTAAMGYLRMQEMTAVRQALQKLPLRDEIAQRQPFARQCQIAQPLLQPFDHSF